MPVEDARPVVAFSAEQERQFLEACDDWQFPLFLTLLCTGLRPGELVHLLLAGRLDLETGWLRIRNKPRWAGRSKRATSGIFLWCPVLTRFCGTALADRRTGPVFRATALPQWPYADHCWTAILKSLEQELSRRCRDGKRQRREPLTRADAPESGEDDLAGSGALEGRLVRKEFMQITKSDRLAEITAPKTLRHTFATVLQDANVDPLIRNELMGHAPAGWGRHGGGLGMTAVYTHTRPDTKRQQLEAAFVDRPAIRYAEQRLARPR